MWISRRSDARLWRTWLVKKSPYWPRRRRRLVWDGLSWVTDVTTLQSGWTGLLFFRIHGTSFHTYSPLLTFFLCFIVLFQSCCSHAQVFGKTLVHEFPISYSHTKWNLLSLGTNTLLWWRACYQKLNYNQKTWQDRASFFVSAVLLSTCIGRWPRC